MGALPSCMIMVRKDPSIASSGVVAESAAYPQNLPAAACPPAAYPQNLPAAACPPSAEAECAVKPSPQGGLPPALQALVKEAPSARRAELEELVRVLQEVLLQTKTEDRKDLLCSLLEDFYYDLKSKGWTHAQAQVIQ